MTARLVLAAVAVLALRESLRASSASVLAAWWGVAAVAAVAAVRGRW